MISALSLQMDANKETFTVHTHTHNLYAISFKQVDYLYNHLFQHSVMQRYITT